MRSVGAALGGPVPQNLKLALNTAALIVEGISTFDGSILGLWLASASVADPFTPSTQLTVHGSLTALNVPQRNATIALLNAYRNVPIVLDASLPTGLSQKALDAEFQEVAALEELYSHN